MLTTLTIRDLAIIADAELTFGSGLNALTGQTGAGKSIIIGALNLVLGDRARTDVIRRGAERAEVTARFLIAPDSPVAERLADLALVDAPPEGEPAAVELIVRRIVAQKGRGRAWINGRPTTVAQLGELTRGLVDISSQHQHTQLLDPASHIDLLDRAGGHTDLRRRYEAAFSAVSAARRALAALTSAERERVQREDFARFQLDEITTVQPVPGEDISLATERARLRHGEALVTGVTSASQRVAQGQGAAVDKLREAWRELSRVAGFDESLQPLVDRVESARIELEDVGFELQSYADAVDMDPRRLTVVEERMAALERLRRKHGTSLEEVLEAADLLRAELEGYASLEREITKANDEVARTQAEAWHLAQALHAARVSVAGDLATRVGTELADLAMAGATIRFRLEATDSLGPRGADVGEIELEANVGEGYAPLVKVASGGELSRVLLALKRVLTTADPVATCVFDEVDTGTGGAVADVIGVKLSQIAAEGQVVVITHLAQIAARAGHHLRVDKKVTEGERTMTDVIRLDAAARKEEIARMLGGVEITAPIRAHARELLARADG